MASPMVVISRYSSVRGVPANWRLIRGYGQYRRDSNSKQFVEDSFFRNNDTGDESAVRKLKPEENIERS